MLTLNRVLDAEPCSDLAAYTADGGGQGLAAMRKISPDAVIQLVDDAGLRGRGGGGFPTATKWRTVSEHRSSTFPTRLVVNAAEGEPGTFKDRTLIRRNPYKVIEGALIAAYAVGAESVVIATKASFDAEIQRLTDALLEAEDAGWMAPGTVTLTLGPASYLFGEETAMLEVIEGRQPFPRVSPPFRRGLGTDPSATGGASTTGAPTAANVLSPADPAAGSPAAAGTAFNSGARAEMAHPGSAGGPPTLVNNVETLANVPMIVTEGPEVFRSVGTSDSPGTIICTISGDTQRDGVLELAMGTTLAQAIEVVGGGVPAGETVTAVASGVSNPLLPVEALDTPLAHDAMQAAGAGLGTGGFLVYTDRTDLVAVAAGMARFLGVESCGQCEPCKQDGLAIAAHLAELSQGNAEVADIETYDQLAETVTDESRCFLAQQQQNIARSMIAHYTQRLVDHTEIAPVDAAPDDVAPARAAGTEASGGAARTKRSEPVLIAPIVDIVEHRAVLDERQGHKQPDWSYEAEDSGATPAERLADVPVALNPRDGGS